MSDSSRHRARELVLQGLYALETGQDDSEHVVKHIVKNDDLSSKNQQFAENLFAAVQNNSEWANSQISALAENWDLDRIATIDQIILRIGLVELEKMPDIPVKVVLNEAIELAKTFSTSKSFSFINGILDKYVRLMAERDKMQS